MDVDMDIDLGPIEEVDPQVCMPIISVQLYSVSYLTLVHRHQIMETQIIFSLLISASTLARYQPSLQSMRLHKRFTFEA